ncbi:MAG: hypothetical protein R2815_12600 [Flavobacteriales bacterium]
MAEGTVIGEIGGSSSRWAFIHSEGQAMFFPDRGGQLPGFNPLKGDADSFAAAIRALVKETCPAMGNAARLEVYGAGCGTPERQDIMRDTLRTIWPDASMSVASDLLGAAIGLHGKGSGCILILGTGMNAGWYDGDRLYAPMPSLGYILGDEGSGADIGRCLLQDAFYGRMPDHVALAIFGPDGPDRGQVLAEVYGSPFPARALAARTALLAPLLDEPYVRDLILSRFHATAELLADFFPQEQRAQVAATGSVAWGFKHLLAECLLDHGMTLTVVERDPLPGLVRRHLPEG